MSNIADATINRLKVLLGWLHRPRQISRSEQEIKRLARETSGISLYDYKWSPACLKTRHEIHHLNIDIELRDIQKCSIHQDSLLSQFGKIKGPCLRIEEKGDVSWIDEPEEIIAYLHGRFAHHSETSQQAA